MENQVSNGNNQGTETQDAPQPDYAQHPQQQQNQNQQQQQQPEPHLQQQQEVEGQKPEKKEEQRSNPAGPLPTPENKGVDTPPIAKPQPPDKQDVDGFSDLGIDPNVFKNRYDGIMQLIEDISKSKPSVVDEKRVGKARTMALIGDVLSLLSQSYSAQRGAHLRERGWNESAMAKAEADERKLRDFYWERLDKYNSAMRDLILRSPFEKTQQLIIDAINKKKIQDDKVRLENDKLDYKKEQDIIRNDQNSERIANEKKRLKLWKRV
ncbi:hypothetical protein FACS1894181_09840 [Bacteroidia bacterium]|nr:hypothetical protein FACS1894181_09840 [Bacteroidia bacterium]